MSSMCAVLPLSLIGGIRSEALEDEKEKISIFGDCKGIFVSFRP